MLPKSQASSAASTVPSPLASWSSHAAYKVPVAAVGVCRALVDWPVPRALAAAPVATLS